MRDQIKLNTSGPLPTNPSINNTFNIQFNYNKDDSQVENVVDINTGNYIITDNNSNNIMKDNSNCSTIKSHN